MENSLFKKYCHYGCSTSGDVGIEIEMETHNEVLDWSFCSGMWGNEEDHSLKKNGRELVLKKPIPFSSVLPVLTELSNGLCHEDIEITSSIRAGVHIHLNMQDNTTEDLKKLMSCYYPIESILTKFCGDGREGNIFCMRARDTHFMGIQYAKFFENGDLSPLQTDDLRYSSLNLQPIFKFGSVEFRAFSTPQDVTDIAVWVSLLEKLKSFAMSVESTTEAMEIIDDLGVQTYLELVFGKTLSQTLHYPEMLSDTEIDLNESRVFLGAGK